MEQAAARKGQPTGVRPVTEELDDLRFRSLLGRDGWDCLPAAVRRRFAKRLCAGKSVSYTGEVSGCRMRPAGWLLAQLCRSQTDARLRREVWTRMYARRHGFPQVIHSAKRFAGPTGLEEYLGCGFGIALDVAACAAGIRFTSNHYFLRVGGHRLRLPSAISPGALTIDHTDLGDGRFAFTLALRHPRLGELIHQIGHFHDQPDAAIGGHR